MNKGSSGVYLGNNEHRLLHSLESDDSSPPPLPYSSNNCEGSSPTLLCRSTSLTSLSTVSDESSSPSDSNNSILADSNASNVSVSSATVLTSGTLKRADRGAAVQQKVQQTWRERREERDQRETAKRGGKPKKTITSSKPPQPLRHKHHAPFGFIPLCAVVQKTWTQTFDNKTKSKPKKAKEDRPKVFPSMLSILESNALVNHVRDLQEEEGEDSDYEDNFDQTLEDSTARSSDSPRDEAPSSVTNVTVQPTTSTSSSDPVVQSVLSILPAGYDWNSAILQMAQSRSRAFLLLDLAAIVRRTVLWKRLYPNITWVHSVSSNANPKLLQVLLVAGVRLATTTRSDIAHALNAKSKLKKAPTSQQHQHLLADSTSHTAPPDSYLRELLGAKVTRLTVDVPDEVHRVVRTVQRVQARHGSSSSSASSSPSMQLELILRLPQDMSQWKTVAESTLQAVRRYPQHSLVGISLDVGTTASSQDRQEQAEQVLQLLLAEKAEDARVQIHLTGFEDLPPSASQQPHDSFPQEWVQWWKTVQQRESRLMEIAVECSYPLIASAGALCTRIIGVREQSTTTKTELGDDVVSKKQSLYIDDGCYGSLYQTKGELHPIPLGNYKNLASSNSDSDGGDHNFLYSSTVWGPTCDGLDRVCRDISLPHLERDDWLVFPNLGCPGALGTAFNGFEPPDTAYCVLGYFK